MGENYHGWQTQSNSISVQSVINHAFSTILDKKIKVVGCGRTDTGVHAEKYYAHFDTDTPGLIQNKNKFIGRINGFLPDDISIAELLAVVPDANARFSAISRTYEYRISLKKNPFLNHFSHFYKGKLDLQLMNEGAEILMMYSDFTSFSKLHSQTTNNICKITEAKWQYQNSLLVFSITADRFLRNMVRAISGTLIELGRGKMSLDELQAIIDSRSRSKAGPSVPAKGLFLVDVRYPDEIFL
jgi:tRNA pseudouridine38-40 synthase